MNSDCLLLCRHMFASRNNQWILFYSQWKKEEAEDTVRQVESVGQKAIALPLDMNQPAMMDAFVALFREALQHHWGATTFDFLVNNAGMGATVPFEQVTEPLFDR